MCKPGSQLGMIFLGSRSRPPVQVWASATALDRLCFALTGIPLLGLCDLMLSGSSWISVLLCSPFSCRHKKNNVSKLKQMKAASPCLWVTGVKKKTTFDQLLIISGTISRGNRVIFTATICLRSRVVPRQMDLQGRSSCWWDLKGKGHWALWCLTSARHLNSGSGWP